MDGSGREQDVGRVAAPEDLSEAGLRTSGRETGGPTQNDARSEGSGGSIRPEGRGTDRHGGGALATDKTDKAVSIQSIVTSDDYAGSSESGV